MRALEALVFGGSVLVLGCATGTTVENAPGTGGSGGLPQDAAHQEASVSEDAQPGLDAVAEQAPDAAAQDGAADVPAETAAEASADAALDVAPEAADPCANVVCSTPPANVCQGSDKLQVYNATGTCSNGTCTYASQLIACQHGCASGACNADPCMGVTCASPPASQCANASYLKVYEAPGSCDQGNCSYGSHQEYCNFGCANDACAGNPCQGVSCTTPPASYCTDGSHLQTFNSPGTCSNGTCTYTNQVLYCIFGCANGACSQDPCAGVSCQSPPAAYCATASTLRKYEALGTCSAGNCTYGSTDVPCAHGCINGACKDCTTDAECSAGTWCNGGSCVGCTTDAHCGTTCTNCLASGQTCQGGAACVCPAGSKLCNSTCVPSSSPQVGCTSADCTPCPLPAYATSANCTGPGGACGFTCDATLHRVPQGSACVCDAAGHFVEQGGACQCEQGYVQQGEQCVPNCPGTVVGSNCYWYESALVTFDVAEATCVSKGGHLASIVDAQENATVRALAAANAWIGLRDLQGNKTASAVGDDCTDAALIDPLGGRYADSTTPLWDDTGPCSKYPNGAEDMFFRLEVATKWTWVFAARSTSFDAYLGLWTRGGGSGYTGCLQTFLQCDDDSGPGDYARIIRTLEPGSYMVIVDAADSWYGSFTLHARRFIFTDGTAHVYQNWNTSEPNDSGNNEGCTEIITSSGFWNDIPCGNAHPAVCKRAL
jgi:hypothetical protein